MPLMRCNMMMAEGRLGLEEELMMVLLQHERSLWEMPTSSLMKKRETNKFLEDTGRKFTGVREQLTAVINRIEELEEVKGLVQKSLESRGGDTATMLEEQRKTVNKRCTIISKMNMDITECQSNVKSLYDDLYAIMLEREQLGTNVVTEQDVWIIKFSQKSIELQSVISQMHALQDRMQEYNLKKERGFKVVPKAHMIMNVEQILLARRIVFLEIELEDVVKHKEELEKVLHNDLSRQGCTDMIITKLRTKIKEQGQELLVSRRLLQEEKLKQEDMITASVNEQQIISAKKIEQLQRELVEVKKTLEVEKSKQAGIESTALNEQQKIFARRINQLERELVEVKNSQDQKRIKENVKDKLKEDLASMQANKVMLEGELRDVTRSITEWTERVNVVEFRLEEVTATYSEIQTELQQILIMLDKHRDDLSTIQEYIETKERDLQDELGQSAVTGMGYAGSELSRAKEEITHKEAFVESSFMRAEELKVKKEELEQEKTVLEQQLKHAKEGKVEREVVRCELVDRLAQIECEILRLLGTGHQQDQPATSMLDDLKRRLQQAAVEYQKLYEEKQKVERQLNELLHRKVPGSVSPLATPPVTEPASVQDLLPESGTCSDVPTATPPLPETTTTTTSGPDLFMCPFCKVTFSPGTYDLFTEHFDNHLS